MKRLLIIIALILISIFGYVVVANGFSNDGMNINISSYTQLGQKSEELTKDVAAYNKKNDEEYSSSLSKLNTAKKQYTLAKEEYQKKIDEYGNLLQADSNYLKNKYFAAFIILSFLIYVMSNGEWCVPIFAWIYPILFLCMVYLNHTRKVYLIISSTYAIGFVVQFGRAIGMDIKICIMVSILLSFLKVLPYIYWSKSKMRFQDTIIFASIMVSIEYIIYLIYPILGGLSDAYTQYQNLYLLQIVTVTGIYGITFLIYWTAAMVIWIWNNKNKKEYIKKYIIVYGSVI